ncbi:hypothetical protein TWF106_010853 [Orbilia oligospora]|uniref:Terpene synthase n=1 Tax=Orbilia oligospora TaxID=2813651 RepID=A0A6G1M7E5_ORBOL|nr:hypothetical protein TWF679_003800 [Orbilia oligospora]KAF3209833.1 hypothetical protein TWF106_010853 [Orbilia oligospora]KAF3224749.1 hypothetical protein TWF191_005915 [Orbilia oligospora]KAF3247389.1 hypothetical protein TWF192_006635 [Orbilia oligospora]
MTVKDLDLAKEARLYEKFLKAPRPQYPFPDLVNPLSEALFLEYYQWIDEDCHFESQSARDRHKRYRLCDITSRAFPWMTLEQLRPVARFTILLAIIDEYMDTTSQEEIEAAKQIVSALFTGLEDKEPPASFYRQMYMIRQDAIACGMPTHMYEEFISSILDLINGYGEEKEYSAKSTPPSMAVYHDIRRRTSGGICYARYLCMQKNYCDLPDSVLHHPTILRMHNLLGTLIGYHSDFISLPKELARGGDVMNLVKVVQNESQLSLEEARARALEIHNESLDELIRLQNTLPDFGEWQKIAQEYADDMGVLLQGVYSWHIQSGSRYVAEADVEPEHLTGGRVDQVDVGSDQC